MFNGDFATYAGTPTLHHACDLAMLSLVASMTGLDSEVLGPVIMYASSNRIVTHVGIGAMTLTILVR